MELFIKKQNIYCVFLLKYYTILRGICIRREYMIYRTGSQSVTCSSRRDEDSLNRSNSTRLSSLLLLVSDFFYKCAARNNALYDNCTRVGRDCGEKCGLLVYSVVIITIASCILGGVSSILAALGNMRG